MEGGVEGANPARGQETAGGSEEAARVTLD
jgi:hypothetical protein